MSIEIKSFFKGMLLGFSIGLLVYRFMIEENILFQKKVDTHEAAQNGLQWLLNHADHAPFEFKSRPYIHLYRVCSNDKVAFQIKEIIRKNSNYKLVEFPKNSSSYQTLPYLTFMNIISRLLDQKQKGEDCYKEIRKIELAITANENHFWNKYKLNESTLLTSLYYLDRLGVKLQYDYDKIISDIRGRNNIYDDINMEYIYYVYAVTHIVITQSDYFRHYLNSVNYPFETKLLSDALTKILNIAFSKKVDDVILDIIGEILICFKLLKAPITDSIIQARKLLVINQNTDGSWGRSFMRSSARFHNTFVITMALIDFREQFRQEDPIF